MKIERTVDVGIKQGQSTDAAIASPKQESPKSTLVSGDTAQVSAQASFAQQGAQSLSEVLIPEDPRVEALRLSVAAGEFHVDDEALAASLADQFVGDK